MKRELLEKDLEHVSKIVKELIFVPGVKVKLQSFFAVVRC